jgi:hypothetical protein
MVVSAVGFVGGVATLVAAAALTRPAAERADCPGKIVCPVTGELVCIDRCPLNEREADAAEPESPPACCRAKAGAK